VTVSPDAGTAGNYGTWTVTSRVGAKGIAEGGGVRYQATLSNGQERQVRRKTCVSAPTRETHTITTPPVCGSAENTHRSLRLRVSRQE
jgi:hypothetical protein